MIDKKKVFLDSYLGGNGGVKQNTTTSIISHKNIEIEKTITTTSTTSIRATNQQEQPNKRGSYVGGSSMMQFMKNSGASGTSQAPQKSNKAYLFQKAA